MAELVQSLGRLLIVDDEGPVREVLSEYFLTQGYAVETAASGPEALELARRARPDLVLLDIRMPGMDGVEVLKRLRELDRDLAVIMVTANEDVALARETLKLGAVDYVSKPFDFQYLDRAVAAGLVQAAAGGLPASAPPGGDDPWRALVLAAFRAARAMAAPARASTGVRLEAAALGAARAAATGRLDAARERLAELELLLGVAAELGDLEADRAPVDAALEAARRALGRA